MTAEQWETLCAVLEGRETDPLPVGFIIDSPWLAPWAGLSLLDYYSSELRWFEANIRAVQQFPEILFLPGFWAEFGMCSEPAAFGAPCRWLENEFPFAERIIDDFADLPRLRRPNPRTDGLSPFLLKRLQHYHAAIEQHGHTIRFAVARGPLNIAGFLIGNTEFLLGMKMDPDGAHRLLDLVTGFLVDWLQLQAETFPTIDGIFILDDMVGFCNESDFLEFAKPCLDRLFQAFPASVRFFHNDAPGLVCAPHLADIGINLFNFSHQHSINEIRRLAGSSVTLLGNIPPRDVLAQGTPAQVRESVCELIAAVEDRRRVILSCGGGMPPGVATENIEAFLEAAGRHR